MQTQQTPTPAPEASPHPALDRHSAQVQARVNVMLDTAEERLAALEARAERFASLLEARFADLLTAAAHTIGHDPRTTTARAHSPATPAPGSLADIVDQAAELRQEIRDACIRLSALSGEVQSARTLGLAA